MILYINKEVNLKIEWLLLIQVSDFENQVQETSQNTKPKHRDRKNNIKK